MRNIEEMPTGIQKRMANLAEDLRNQGPYQASWPNYGRISRNQYNCHLAYNWVACWYWKKESMDIEVYYVGSRQNAPY
jgi:hypothetical protein